MKPQPPKNRNINNIYMDFKRFPQNWKDTKTELKIVEPNYKGLSMLVDSFTELYKVCENKELLDKCLEDIFLSKTYTKKLTKN